MNLIGRYQRVSGSEKITPRWEQDYHLQPMGKLGLFYEYLEMSKFSVKYVGMCVGAENHLSLSHKIIQYLGMKSNNNFPLLG